MELNVIGAKPVSLSDEIFGKEFREDLVHQVVVAYRNAGRAGTKAQKTRSEVNGTTKKEREQEGGAAALRRRFSAGYVFVNRSRALAATWWSVSLSVVSTATMRSPSPSSRSRLSNSCFASPGPRTRIPVASLM